MQSSSKKTFYGWKIVAACFCLMCFSMGLVFNSNALFIKPICEDLGFSRPQISLNLTLYSVGQMIIAFFSGKIFSRFQVKNVMRVSAIVICLSTGGLAFAHTLPVFYILSLFIGISMGGICVVPISLLVSKWFHDCRGMAIGISMTGSGIGGMIFNYIIGYTIPHFGWRMSYIGGAILMTVTLLPLVFLVIKEKPSDIGLLPLGDTEETKEVDPSQLDGVTMKDAMRGPVFWTFLFCILLTTIGSSSMFQSMSPYLTDIGYSYSFAAIISALGMGSLAFGKTFLGIIYDKTSPRFGTVFSGLCGIISLTATIFAMYKPSLIVYVICTGMGGAFGTVSYPILTEALFGKKDYTAIYGIMSFTGSLGVSLSPIITSTFFDVTGTYRYAFMIFLVITCISVTLFAKMLPSRTKETVKTNQVKHA